MSKIAAAAAGSAFGAFLRMARAERAITLGRKVQPECRKQANCACTNLTSNLHSEGAPENEQNSRGSGGERFRRVFANGAGRTGDNFGEKSSARMQIIGKSCLHEFDKQSAF